jgi:hypothetical protein
VTPEEDDMLGHHSDFHVSIEQSTEDNGFGPRRGFPIVDSSVRTPNKLLHDTGHETIAVDQNNRENYSNTCIELRHGQSFYPFEIYVLCDSVKTGMSNALVDTGSQVSLVTKCSLNKGVHIEKCVTITWNYVETKGQVELCIGETSPHKFLVVDILPINCDILLGQDWLERFGYQFQILSLGITLPAYSETLVRLPTTERGNRLVEAQELQENIFCASSVVECKDASFLCFIANLNSTDQILRQLPQTQDLPKLSGRSQKATNMDLHSRNQLLQTQLRLAHIKEGEEI